YPSRTSPTCRPDGLPGALILPSVDQDGVVLAAAQYDGDFRCVKSGKAAVTGGMGDVAQESVRVSAQQIKVPIELHAEPGARLLLRGRLMAVINVHPQFGMRRHRPVPGGVVLDGMCAEDCQAVFSMHVATTAR